MDAKNMKIFFMVTSFFRCQSNYQASGGDHSCTGTRNSFMVFL